MQILEMNQAQGRSQMPLEGASWLVREGDSGIVRVILTGAHAGISSVEKVMHKVANHGNMFFVEKSWKQNV